MKKKTNSTAKIKKQIRKEVDAINKETHDYVISVMNLVKKYPKGLKRIAKHVKAIAKNMDKLEAHVKKVGV